MSSKKAENGLPTPDPARPAPDPQEARQAEPVDELTRLRTQLKEWETFCIIEVAVRNPNVSSYMEHWEGRALKAEAALTALRQAIRESCKGCYAGDTVAALAASRAPQGETP